MFVRYSIIDLSIFFNVFSSHVYFVLLSKILFLLIVFICGIAPYVIFWYLSELNVLLIIFPRYILLYPFLEVNGKTVTLSVYFVSSEFNTIAKWVWLSSEPIFTPKSTFIIWPLLYLKNILVFFLISSSKRSLSFFSHSFSFENFLCPEFWIFINFSHMFLISSVIVMIITPSFEMGLFIN